MTSRDQALDYALINEARYIQQLKQLLAIPSISTLPAHQADVQQTAEWVRDECTRIGFDHAQLLATDGNPVVYADWLHADDSAPTILIYGHYDVQPPDPLELWDTPPFKPTLCDGKIFARGASDNKAQFFSHLKAIESILARVGKLPIHIKICLDGEEEIGSPNMAAFTAAHQDLLATDVVIVSDGAMVDSDNPTIEYALRGVMMASIYVSGPARDLHSGSYGGTVHNPAQAIAEIVAALHDEQGRVAIPGFYEDMQPLTEAERAFLQNLPYSDAQWQTETGAPQAWGDDRYTILERITALPTCEVNGIWGGVMGDKMKTIIPATAGANLSMRLVANQDPAKIAQQLQDYVLSLAPSTVNISVKIGSGGAKAAVTPYDSPFITAAQTAYRQGWQAEAHISRAGGSLPIVATFQDILHCPFVLMPFGLDDNRHSPNEHYHLSHLRKGIATAVHFYYELAH